MKKFVRILTIIIGNLRFKAKIKRTVKSVLKEDGRIIVIKDGRLFSYRLDYSEAKELMKLATEAIERTENDD